MKVIFSHGKESGPWGFKIKRLSMLAQMERCQVESVDYTSELDPDERVKMLLEVIAKEEGDFILVGSSMGGYVSLVASELVDARALFLIAPALAMPGFAKQQYHSRCAHIEVVHGWSDDIIPVENSIAFAQQADCGLHIISGDHPLNDSIVTIEQLFTQFLNTVFNPQ
ncbi:MAG: pimeloyl-ACP methyl ester carboxylesterase [Planctomycetota bacterium]|jgi:pimeloyl-ACP methyl ester carboxylesterase